MNRPSFDFIFCELVKNLAKRSTCERLQVGCIVTTMDNCRILSMGYNGGPKGLFNSCQSNEPGKCLHMHAEINSLIKLNYNAPSDKKMYVTTAPCINCSIAIINADIKEVIYINDYRKTEGIDMLKSAGIKVRKYEENF